MSEENAMGEVDLAQQEELMKPILEAEPEVIKFPWLKEG